MRLAISNLAWDPDEDEVIAKLLHRFNVDAIDIAPGKYFPEPMAATDEAIAKVAKWWADKGIEITGMQALLFGTTGLNVFGSPEIQQAMLQHLRAICRIGAGLGATRLVFGSPKNRDRTGLGDQEAIDLAVPFFRRLGDHAQEYGVVICLEPNPVSYGANFMTTSIETGIIVEMIAHPAIKMQLDTGALTMNNEEFESVIQACGSHIGHVHASEPNLIPLGDDTTNHAKIAQALQRHLPDHIVAIEMLATKNEPHQQSIERALRIATRHYQRDNGVLSE